MAKKAYKNRSDLERIQSQWWKLAGLHTREESSAAIIRAATATEIAANFAIRTEFKKRSSFNNKFIDHQLRGANGIAGKLDRLLLPLFEDKAECDVVKNLKSLVKEINQERNAIAHQGEFRDKKKAAAVISKARKFIETLIRIYEPSFQLKESTKARAPKKIK